MTSPLPCSSSSNVHQCPLLLDGGLGTSFEILGFHVRNPLWSAKLLCDNPDAVRDVHVAFFNAGAQCATTNTYQASIPGFIETLGYSHSKASELIWKGVEVANEARDIVISQRLTNSSIVKDFDQHTTGSTTSSSLDSLSKTNGCDDAVENYSLPYDVKLKVIRSCGPYGAYLHDGSEYTGIYKDATDHNIKEFHRSRLDILRRDLPESDIICFETIPNRREALIIYELLREYPDLRQRVWICFCCKESGQLRCGYPFKDIIVELLTADQHDRFLCGVGLNCTAPDDALECISSLQFEGVEQVCSEKLKHEVTLVAYPNSGEGWDPVHRCFIDLNHDPLIPAVGKLLDNGVRAIGGCCRVGPEKIQRIREETLNWIKTRTSQQIGQDHF